MGFKPLSEKQLKAMFWWSKGSGSEQYDAVICDGAVRSGKTFALSLSFVTWASLSFHGAILGFCGKTITALRRNVIMPLLPCLRELGFDVDDRVSQSRLTVRFHDHENTFFLFSGKDEGSASLIQGVTLSGVMFDEVALMPRSFVEQALAREMAQRTAAAVHCTQALRADALGLGARLFAAQPIRWQRGDPDWSKRFPNVPVTVTVRAHITGTQDLTDPVPQEGSA